MGRALLLLMAVAVTGTMANELPDFGNAADVVLSKSREQQIGRSVLLQLRNADVILDDPLMTEYIRLLGSRIASHANDGDFDFNFYVIDDDRINAFAMPGGHIGVHTGLILASDNESELAGVLAHEVSHVTQRHIARSLYDNQRSSIMSIAAMIAAALVGVASDASGEAVAGIMTAGQAMAVQRQINFTRSNEHEADRIGIDVLSAAGFDPNAMATFFDKLSRRSGATLQSVPEMLRTHPVSTTRVAEARSRARSLPAVANVDSPGYGLAKARLQVLTQPTGEAAMAVFDQREDSDLAADRYGRALALMRIGLFDNAYRLFTGLIAQYPGITAFRIGAAEALFAGGLIQEAMAIYREAIKLSPRNIPLTISYADALIEAGQPDVAHEVLLDLLNNVPPTPTQIRLIARAAEAEGDGANAHYYMAEYFLSIGNLRLSINQLQLALQSPEVHAVDRSRYQARLDQIVEYLPEEERVQGSNIR